MTDQVNVRIKTGRDGAPFTPGVFVDKPAAKGSGHRRKLEPGEIVTIPADTAEKLASLVDVVDKPASRPLLFPTAEIARASSPLYKPLDSDTSAQKAYADEWLAKWQLEQRKAAAKASRAAARAEGEGKTE